MRRIARVVTVHHDVVVSEIDGFHTKEGESKSVHWFDDCLNVTSRLGPCQCRIAGVCAAVFAQAEKSEMVVGPFSGNDRSPRDFGNAGRTNSIELFVVASEITGLVDGDHAVAACATFTGSLELFR